MINDLGMDSEEIDDLFRRLEGHETPPDAALWARLAAGVPAAGDGQPEDIERLYQIAKWNDGTTICGMGDAAGYATAGILNKFRDEFEYSIQNKRSRCDGNLECLGSS